MSAELILAIVGVADGCIKLANKALSTCRAYRDAEQDLARKVTILETVWVKLETQLSFLRRVADQGHLKDELAQCHFTLLQKLNGALLQAVSELEIASSSLESRAKTLKFLRVGKWKYAIMKKTLDTLLAELEAWQGRFDPSWYLIILISRSVLDPVLVGSSDTQGSESNAMAGPLDNMRALRRVIDAESPGAVVQDLGRLDLDVGQLTNIHDTMMIRYTSAKLMVEAQSGARLVTEPVDLSTIINAQSIPDIERLARRLRHIDPDTFGLLRCEGLLRRADPQSGRLRALEVIYRAPSTPQPPMTLRQCLLDQKDASLSAIINLAKQLVRSVSYIHACNFVHKNIRPENILIFPPPDTPNPNPNPIGTAYLVGLTQFRSLAHQTNLLGDSAWHRNLYRHPARQGLRILDGYVMQHDIYSLGVCLLEIGLWRPLVWYPTTTIMETAVVDGDEMPGCGGGDAGDVSTVSEPVPVPGLALALRNVLTDKVFERAHVGDRTGWVKEDLVGMARRMLPARMGDMYTRVVESCLTCLDEGNEAFGSFREEEGGDGVAVGVRFIEKILARVSEIRV